MQSHQIKLLTHFVLDFAGIVSNADDLMGSTERKSGQSRLRSFLPKVLLHDNVSLTYKLQRQVTLIGVEERKHVESLQRAQKHFIIRQALKIKTHGMDLFPYLQNGQSNHPVDRVSQENSTNIAEGLPRIPCPGAVSSDENDKVEADYGTATPHRPKTWCETGGAQDGDTRREFARIYARDQRRMQNPMLDRRFMDLQKLIQGNAVRLHSFSASSVDRFR